VAVCSAVTVQQLYLADMKAFSLFIEGSPSVYMYLTRPEEYM
jgi:hypothetical protein